MEEFKKLLSELQGDAVKIMRHLSRLLMSNSESKHVIEKNVNDYLYELESLCIKSRNILDPYAINKSRENFYISQTETADVTGDITVTNEGWIKITLNTLLPSCKYKTSNYIGDTITRLIKNCGQDLPYFDEAFLAIVEYANHENHNALDNDNKGWKMIPNALKGRVLEDDNQFVLSIGLFSKLSENVRSEIYVMLPEDGSVFMDLLNQDML